MRLAWAFVAGALGAGVLAWWQAREPQAPASAPASDAMPPTAADRGGLVLYRWRDEHGVVQVTDAPPEGRPYTVVDVAARERRNTIDPNPAREGARRAPRQPRPGAVT